MNNLIDNPGAALAELLEVRTYGDPVLRQKARPVRAVTPEIRKLAARMIVTMMDEDARGVGLAAPQVGIGIRLITLETRDDSKTLPANPSPGDCVLAPRMPMALVNPELVWFSKVCASCNEGCLSIPNVNGDVVRPIRIVLRATTLDGETINVECGGLLARCLQHEIDHLDGILFVDRLTGEAKARVQPDLERVQRQSLRRLKRQNGLLARLVGGARQSRVPVPG